MAKGSESLFKLLKPYMLRHKGALVAIIALGAGASFCLRLPLGLLDLLWDGVMFPLTEAEKLVAATEAANKEALGPDWISSFKERGEGLRQSLQDGAVAIFGGSGELTVVDEKLAKLWAVGFLLVGIALLAAIFHYFFYLVSRRTALRMTIALREELAAHLLRLSVGYHGSRRFGDLLSRVAQDVTSTLAVIRQATKDLILEPLTALFSLGIAFYALPGPALVVMVVLAPLALPFMVLGRKVRKTSKKSFTALGDSLQVLTEMLQGIRIVKAFRAEQRELIRYREVNASFFKSSMKMERAVGTTRASTILLSHSGLAILLVGVCYLIVTNDGIALEQQGFWAGLIDPPIEEENLILFFASLSLAYNHLRRALDGWTKVQAAGGAAVRLSALLAEPVDISDAHSAQTDCDFSQGIKFENLRFRYPDAEEDALVDFKLHIKPGETLALVGPSGAGKSTVIDLVARFIDPTEGRVSLGNTDLRELALDAWTEQYAMVGQTPFLFHTSILENIRYGRPAATRAEIEGAARAANIHDFILTLPHGYDTEVGEAGARLSGGQRQRLTIARAILKEAPLLLLDEATSALDSESEQAVQEALSHLMRGRTVIVIAHRLSTIREADRIAVMEAGRLVELGTHEELLAARGVYSRLHAVQYGEPDADRLGTT